MGTVGWRRLQSAICWVLLLALALRLLLWAQPLHKPANDEVEYIQVARDLLAGRGWQFYEHYHWLRAPLYPLFLAGSLWLAGGDLHLAALPNILLSVATVYLIYRLALLLARERRAGDRETGDGRRETGDQETRSLANLQPLKPSTFNLQPSTVAALLAALLFTYATFASLYMSETLFTFLFTAALLAMLQWRAAGESRDLSAGGASSQFSVFGSRLPSTALRAGSALVRHWRLALAGLLYGLAVLTRSLPLAFMPLAILWIVLTPFEGRSAGRNQDGSVHAPRIPHLAPRTVSCASASTRLDPAHASCIPHPASRIPRIIPALIFLIAVALPIAPWTLRNCQAYGACILVETGLSYNLWAFSEPREDQQTIFRVLEQIPNPAARAAEASRRGMERLREDPAILARKLLPNWVATWSVKPIEDRFLLTSYYADPPPLVFLAALLLDDGLYLVILAAAALGLGRAALAGRPGAVLSALWVVAVVGVSLLTHGEGRYRHFFLMVLIPFAALWIAQGRDQGRASPSPETPPRTWGWESAIAAVLVITALAFYPWAWAGAGAARSLHRMAGDIALARGELPGATAAYQRALEADSTPDGWLALGHTWLRRGQPAQAEFAYRAAWDRARPYVAASATLADFLRGQGRLAEARAAFVGRYVLEQSVVDWSWERLAPPPARQIAVGDGLDFGYVGGVYAAEEQQGARARWTNGHARLRLAAVPELVEGPASSGPAIIRLRLAAPHPGGQPVAAQVCAAGRCQPVILGPAWRTVALVLPALPPPGGAVELRSPTFVAPDGRTLGVLLDWAEIRRLGARETGR